ncbi:MAG TPA: carboxypeptidase regulatory-like domain-containing protein [Terriglobales bacterium]|nr:carboxypeptidase regulatory-like domain-containing protein [Terriglobales bacterium]
MISRPSARQVVGIVFGLCLVAASFPAFAQSTAGRILGGVSDQTGAAVNAATVVITDVQRGTSRTVTTDETGQYVASDLQPSTYKIRVTAAGFRSVDRGSIEVEVAKDVRADFSLQPGQVSDTVEVNSEVPLVDVTSSTLGGTLSNKEINDLPLNGRNYQNLLQLRPGVMRYPGGGFSTTSANGLRAEDNAYMVEGLLNSEPFSGQGMINGAGIVGDSATILPIDAIQEFNLLQNPPAEYGWKPGAIVNVGLKSGTNTVHGSAFAFGRDGAMDARNYFNQAPAPKTGRTLEQFGFSFGGAIIKNKAFYFGSYEGQKYDIGNTFGVTTPSMVTMPAAGTCLFVSGDCGGSIPDAIADLQAAGVTISPASLKVAGCSLTGSAVSCDGSGFPTNNNPTIDMTQGFPNQATTHNAVGKLDYYLNAHHTLSGMYFFGNNSGTVEDFPELQSQWRSQIHTRSQVVGASWVWTPSPRWVNEVRVGYSRLYQPTLPGDLGKPASAYGLDTGVSGPFTGGLPRIGFAGAFVPGLGAFKWPKFQGPDTITQFTDHVSYTAGKHAFKFGGELHRTGVSGGAFGNARGSITFLGGNTPDPADPSGQTFLNTTALEDFFAGTPFKVSVQSGDPRRNSHNWEYALFGQDDWRATKNLTINLGLRYEYRTVLKEEHNLLGNFDPNSPTGLIQVGINGVKSPYNADPKNFGPRFGFAWDVTGKGSTVLRGGASMIYETVNWESFLAFNNSYGLSNVPTGAIISGTGTPNQQTAGGTITAANLTIFPDPTVPWDNGPIYGSNLSSSTINCDPAVANPCPIMSVVRNLKTPFVWSWNLNLQHAFTPKLSLEMAYVGNHGTHLTGIRDINQEALGSDDQTTRPFNAKFPYLSNIFQMGNFYKSNYNGLQSTLTARNYHGLSMVMGYTYAHSLDDVGANWDFGAGYGLPQDSNNVAAEYANSDFDIRHRLTLSLTYAIPGKGGFAQMLEGWEINSITTLQSGQPWGVIDLGSDIAGFGNLPVSPPQSTPVRWNFFGKPSDFTAGPTPIPFFSGGDPNMPAACTTDAGAAGAASLSAFGCFAKGNSVLLPPAFGTLGTMGRNIFRDSGFRTLDFSVAKNWHLGERVRAQFRAEFFNILNHPNFANPYGGQNGFGNNDPSVGAGFGCECLTPDVAAANPAIGSGGPRSVQLGLKFLF